MYSPEGMKHPPRHECRANDEDFIIFITATKFRMQILICFLINQDYHPLIPFHWNESAEIIT